MPRRRTSPEQSPSPGSGSAARRTAAPQAVTLAFAGDVNFARRTARLLKHPLAAFGPIRPVLSAADFTAVNLETAVTTRGVPQPKQFHFRTTGKAFTAVRAAGIDLVTMANNHVLDYGRTGLHDTIAAARRARFPYVGIGRNARAAWAPYITTIHGVRIAVIGVSQVTELASSWVATRTRSGEANAINVRRTLAAVRAARKRASVVIVFMHWGTEGQSCPDSGQLSLAPRLAAAGASIIVGAHAHVLQGSGWLGHTFVAYGMGNFLWWEHSYSTATGVLKLTLHPHRPLTARFVPAVVSATGQPVAAARSPGPARRPGLRPAAGLHEPDRPAHDIRKGDRMTPATLSTKALNRATLDRQMLLERARKKVPAALEHLVGMQAQAPDAPYVGLWTRLAGFRPGDLAGLIEARKAVRAPLMRATVHLVTAADCAKLRPWVQPVQERSLRQPAVRQETHGHRPQRDHRRRPDLLTATR